MNVGTWSCIQLRIIQGITTVTTLTMMSIKINFSMSSLTIFFSMVQVPMLIRIKSSVCIPTPQ